MNTQLEQPVHSARRLAKIGLVFSSISILGPVAFLLWSVLEDIFQLDMYSLIGSGDFLIVYGMVAGLLGLPGMVIGVIALRKMKENKQGKGFAIMGIVLGIIGFLFDVFSYFIFFYCC